MSRPTFGIRVKTMAIPEHGIPSESDGKLLELHRDGRVVALFEFSDQTSVELDLYPGNYRLYQRIASDPAERKIVKAKVLNDPVKV